MMNLSRRYWFASLASRVGVLTPVLCLLSACGTGVPDGSNDMTGSAAPTTQTWILNLEGPPVQVVTVTVPPATIGSTTFTTVSGGWYAADRFGRRGLVTVGGTIAPSSPGDHWDFVGMTGNTPEFSVQGTGSGVANAKYPNSTSVQGTVTWRYIFVGGSPQPTSQTSNWKGLRVN